MKFKVGDKVKLTEDSASELHADMIADLREGGPLATISPQMIAVRETLNITQINEDEISLDYHGLDIGYVVTEDDLILVSTKEADAQDDKLLANVAKMEKAAAQISDAEAVKAQAVRIRDLVSENQRLRKAAQMVIDDFDQTGCSGDMGTVMADNINALKTALQ